MTTNLVARLAVLNTMSNGKADMAKVFGLIEEYIQFRKEFTNAQALELIVPELNPTEVLCMLEVSQNPFNGGKLLGLETMHLAEAFLIGAWLVYRGKRKVQN